MKSNDTCVDVYVCECGWLVGDGCHLAAYNVHGCFDIASITVSNPLENSIITSVQQGSVIQLNDNLITTKHLFKINVRDDKHNGQLYQLNGTHIDYIQTQNIVVDILVYSDNIVWGQPSIASVEFFTLSVLFFHHDFVYGGWHLANTFR